MCELTQVTCVSWEVVELPQVREFKYLAEGKQVDQARVRTIADVILQAWTSGGSSELSCYSFMLKQVNWGGSGIW